MSTVTWYLVGSPNPYAQAVEAEPNGITVPDDVIDWATGHGLSMDDPDVYLLVAPCEEAFTEVIGLIATTDGEVSDEDGARLVKAIADLEAERAERRAE